jgi:uncharacterized protein (TIGR02391 family)
MARKVPAKESVPPTLTPQRAIELIRRQLELFGEIEKLHSDDPKAKQWHVTTTNILDAAFGKPDGEHHQNAAEFKRFTGQIIMGMGDAAYQISYRNTLQHRRAVLQSCIEQLELLASPAAQVASGQYRFHLEIERVSGQLFRDGHYKQAAFEAYVRVIEEVKTRSGLAIDGDSLMNHAFGCEGRTPVIQFNSLQTEAERDEQKGFMFLFKGIVGLRNTKAHSNRLFNDPHRAHEYLALASVLMRVLEISTVNQSN